MEQPITDVEQVNPEWLTQVLRKKGVLTQGQVTAVHKKPSQTTLTSLIFRLEASYSNDAPASAPSCLLLKMSGPDVDAVLSSMPGKTEIAFYTTVADAMSDPPTVRCYDAAYSPETGESHLLLADVSDTHFQTEWPLPPAKQHCEQVMACVAKFHAFWWEHPRLGKDIGQLPTAEAIKEILGNIERMAHEFVDFLGDRLSVDRRQVYEKVLAALPRLLSHHIGARLTAGKTCTLVHGDAHFWNFLYPHDADKDKVYLIDWQSWGIGIGTDDLAYMIALHWYPERRRAMERALISRYHQELMRHGVANYTWPECWFDYRVSATFNLFVPAGQWSLKIPAAIWWPHLERALCAFQDLRCDELLET
jgi:thiamine kinase-like enzyme